MTTDPFRPLKTALGRFATGIVLAGCQPEGVDAPVLITANSFASVSLAPPLVLWCLDRKASTFAPFMAAGAYGISVLKAEHRELSELYSRHGPKPFDADRFTTLETGAPILRDALAAFDCRVVDRREAGDHVVLIGEVVQFQSSAGAPLLYFASGYRDGPIAP